MEGGERYQHFEEIVGTLRAQFLSVRIHAYGFVMNFCGFLGREPRNRGGGEGPGEFLDHGPERDPDPQDMPDFGRPRPDFYHRVGGPWWQRPPLGVLARFHTIPSLGLRSGIETGPLRGPV